MVRRSIKTMEFCVKQLKSDCEELLKRFQETESVRFEVFSKIWREMKFSEIFYGVLKWEQRVFSRLALDTALCFLLPPFSFQIRVGGLYLLYSLYESQTASPPEMVRVALKDWEDVVQFEKDVVDAQHLDVVYILRKMQFNKTFHFTAMPTTLSYRKRRRAERSALCQSFMERTSRPQELINMDLLEEMSNVHDLYENLKASVTSSASGHVDPSVSLSNQRLVPELRSTVLDFYKWQKRNVIVDDSGEGTSSQLEGFSRATLLASIKSRAYGQAAEALKSRRHRQVHVDFSSAAAGYIPKLWRYSYSLKRKTKETVHISSDLWKDADVPTRINRLTEPDSVPEERRKQPRTFKW